MKTPIQTSQEKWSISKVNFQAGEIFEASKDGFMVFLEVDEWNFPIVKIAKDHPFLEGFLNNINPPQKFSRIVNK